MQKIYYGQFNNSSVQEVISRVADYLQNGKDDKFCYLAPTPQMLGVFQQKILKSANLRGTGRLHLYLFKGLANEILKAAGEMQRVITPFEQEVYLRQAVEELNQAGRLDYFEKISGYDGFYRGLQGIIREFEEGGNNHPAELFNDSDQMKEQELGLIISNYFSLLEKKGLQDEGLVQQAVLNEVRQGNKLIDSIDLFIIDGFQRLTGFQYQLIRALAEQDKDIIINFMYDRERPELYEDAEMVFQSLDFTEEYFPVQQVNLESQVNPESQVLSHLQENLFKPGVEQLEADSSLQLIEAVNRSAEIEELAGECKKLIYQGVKPEKIGIIIRDPAAYFSLVDDQFSAVGLPYNISRGLPLLQSPVWKIIRDLFRAVGDNFSRRSVLNLLTSNYLNFLEVEEYGRALLLINQAGVIRGGDWYRLSNNEDRLALKILQAVEQLSQFRSAISHKGDFLVFAELTWQLLLDAGLESGIFNQAEREWLIRDLKAFQLIEGKLKAVADLLQGKSLDYRQFYYWLERSLQEEEIRLNRDMGSSQIQIMTPSQARGKSFKILFMIGLLEGEFPRWEKRDWVLSSQERSQLAERGIHLFNERQQLVQERFFFYRSLLTAENKIYLSYPSYGAEEGGELISSFVQEVKNLFKEESLSIRRANGQSTRSRNIKQAVTVGEARAIYLENCSSVEAESLLPALTGEKNRWGGKFTVWDGLLEDEMIQRKMIEDYGPQHVFSPSELEGYAHCPFKFFATRVLGLSEEEEPQEELKTLQLGTLYHQILFQFFAAHFPGNWNQDWEVYQQLLQKAAFSVFKEFAGAVIIPEGRWQLYQEEIIKNLETLLQSEWREKGYLPHPDFLEYSFGLPERLRDNKKASRDNPVNIEVGDRELKLKGKIDRIDFSSDGKKAVIWDYKLGSHQSSYKQMVDGLDLQIPLYLLAAEEIFTEQVELIGAGYYIILKNLKDGIWRGKFEENIPVTGRSSSCLEEDDWIEHLQLFRRQLADYLEGIRAADFRVSPGGDCGYCDFVDICRFEQRRIGGFNE